MTKSSPTKSKLNNLQTKHDETVAELRRYKLLVENVQDYAIFLMDKNGYIQTWNKGAQKNKGYSADEIIGKHFSIFYTDKDIQSKKPERELVDAINTGRTEDEDWRVRKDGSKFWANVVITALHDDSGELVGFAKVTRNLTERKKQEDNLRQANALLLKQQEELTQLNKSKDEFISLASHQLRTPATAIKQLLGLALEGFAGDLPEDIRPILQRSYESNERQINIVNSLLKVAQIDAGKVILRKEQTDANQLIQDIADEYGDTITERKQTLVLDLASSPAMISADKQYLRMALENIIDNASKYTYENGTVTVKIAINNRKCVISVEDTGVGIGPEDIATLFEKFKRVSNDLSQKVAGSGLGLYWAQRVIELHNGDITVKSELHKGTVFHITLPIEGIHA
jgi:PAS domain S-box-containing protein